MLDSFIWSGITHVILLYPIMVAMAAGSFPVKFPTKQNQNVLFFL